MNGGFGWLDSLQIFERRLINSHSFSQDLQHVLIEQGIGHKPLETAVLFLSTVAISGVHGAQMCVHIVPVLADLEAPGQDWIRPVK